MTHPMPNTAIAGSSDCSRVDRFSWHLWWMSYKRATWSHLSASRFSWSHATETYSWWSCSDLEFHVLRIGDLLRGDVRRYYHPENWTAALKVCWRPEFLELRISTFLHQQNRNTDRFLSAIIPEPITMHPFRSLSVFIRFHLSLWAGVDTSGGERETVTATVMDAASLVGTKILQKIIAQILDVETVLNTNLE